ncbi:cytochrome P450 [Schizophyllum commune]
MESTLLTLAFAAALAWLACLLRAARNGKRDRLPPGPPTIPILGNLLQLSSPRTHLQFTEWAKKYNSDIITVMLGPAPAIILSSARAVKEVLDKQSGSTSDRPPLHINMVVTGDLDIVLARYTERWRRIRKAEHLLLSTTTVQKFIPIQEAESAQLLYEFATAPKDFYHHLERYAASTVLSITYGKRSVRYESSVAEEFTRDFNRWLTLMAPGNHPPVDMFPFLQKLPEFLAPWKTEAREVRKLQRGLFMRLLEECEERVATGDDTPFYMADILRSQESLGLEREQLAYLGGDLFGAGTDTTATTLQMFVWLMVKYPAVQKKAQEEIDRVIGHLPVQEDAKDVPYLQAVIQELHRLHVLSPMAAPHAATKDVAFDGYIIPKGAFILSNIYAIYHDEEAFRGSAPACTSLPIRSSVMIAAMRLLWAFSFEPAKDAAGQEIPLDMTRWKTAFVEGPLPFECSVLPRSAEHMKVVERAFKVGATPILKTVEYRLDERDEEWLKQVRKSG